MASSRRQAKKWVVRRFEADFGRESFNYKRLVRPGKGKAKLWGVGVAGTLYLAAFTGGYFGWTNGYMDDAVFAKLVWILMIPCTVVGAVTWLVVDSRQVYDVRRRLKETVARLEAEGGRLWRYGPLLEQLQVKGVDLERVAFLSREGRGAEIDPQDYAETIESLSVELMERDGLRLDAEVVERLEGNFHSAAT